MSGTVLLVDDDRAVREALAQTLTLADYTVQAAGSYIEAKDHITPEFTGCIVSDIRMPGKDGFALLAYAIGVDADLPVILLTGEGDIPMAVRGMSAGAYSFLEKPCSPADLTAVVERALHTRALVLENRKLKRDLQSGDAAARMVFGTSRLAEELRATVRRVAATSAAVLITGAPGAGNAKVAEVIHLLGAGSRQPFEKRAAAALDAAGLRAALEQAAGGTLFLDEVAALSAVAQFALLETLEAGAPARVVAGSYRNLRAAAEEGAFNPDLFYRLDALHVRIPALRERPEDIPVLFRQYLRIACEQSGVPEPDVPPEMLSRLMAQDWPGNARALMNAAMRYALGLGDTGGDATAELGLSEQMAAVERSLLSAALQRFHGNASEAARALHLPRKTFYDKLHRHGLRADLFRD